MPEETSWTWEYPTRTGFVKSAYFRNLLTLPLKLVRTLELYTGNLSTESIFVVAVNIENESNMTTERVVFTDDPSHASSPMSDEDHGAFSELKCKGNILINVNIDHLNMNSIKDQFIDILYDKISYILFFVWNKKWRHLQSKPM